MPIVSAISGGGVGYVSALGIQKRSDRVGRERAARGIASPARDVLKRLEFVTGHFDRARATDIDAIIAYFRAPDPIVGDPLLSDLQQAVQEAKSLSLACLDSWRRGVGALNSLQSSHEGLRKLSGLSGQRSVVDSRADGYRQLIRDAHAAVREALKSTRHFADLEVRRAIDAAIVGAS